MDPDTRTEVEAAAFRTLLAHLRKRSDVQNIDLMNLAGFCRNCLSRWYAEAASEMGLEISREDSREYVYGMSYADWKKQYQKEASVEQQEVFAKVMSDPDLTT